MGETHYKPEWHCSFCLYDNNRDRDDDPYELNTLTIINGHLTCLVHAGYAQGGDWSLKLAALLKKDGR